MEEKKEIKTYMKIKLCKPVDYQGMHVDEIDLHKIETLTGEDMNEIYDLYATMGDGRITMQESTLRFAQITAQRVTGLPLELITKLDSRDSIRLKNKIFRFFYQLE